MLQPHLHLEHESADFRVLEAPEGDRVEGSPVYAESSHVNMVVGH